MKSPKLFLSLFACVLFLTNCGNDNETDANKQSLYERLGSKDAVRKVVESAIPEIAGKASLTPYFAILLSPDNDPASTTALIENITDFIVEAAGGPAGTYKGKSMVDAHSESENLERYTDDGPITSAIYGDFVDAIMAGAQAHITDAELLTDFEALLNSLEIIFVNN